MHHLRAISLAERFSVQPVSEARLHSWVICRLCRQDSAGGKKSQHGRSISSWVEPLRGTEFVRESGIGQPLCIYLNNLQFTIRNNLQLPRFVSSQHSFLRHLISLLLSTTWVPALAAQMLKWEGRINIKKETQGLVK